MAFSFLLEKYMVRISIMSYNFHKLKDIYEREGKNMHQEEKAKTINGLMIHLRDDCDISIKGSREKQQLIQYGYYHGYKGFRFYKKRQNTIPYRNFSEIVAVINYDMA